MDNATVVKKEHSMEHDEARSSGSAAANEQDRIRQLEQAQELMRQQMEQMSQLLQKSNGGVGGEASYPCPNFGQVPFKREAKDSSGAALNNNNSEDGASDKSLNKDKLWNLYLAGKVSLDGVKDVKSKVKPSPPDSDIEEIELEEDEDEEVTPLPKEDPTREGFSLEDWDLVYDEGKIAAILCEPCR